MRVPAGLPQARAKLGVPTLQQFRALSQFLNLSGLGEQQLSQGLHLRRDLRSHGSKLTQFQNEGAGSYKISMHIWFLLNRNYILHQQLHFYSFVSRVKP